jgi:GntR family carbon starvation induced transcriptional regulator
MKTPHRMTFDPSDLEGRPSKNTTSSSATLSAQVYERLRDDIVSGYLPPGQRLTLESLGERYGVGMTPLREALYRLSASQLILGEDRRGFRVAPATIEHLEDILATRQHVEPLVLRSAFEAGDLAWEARVLAAFHKLRGTAMYDPETHAIRPEWEVTHRAFHLSVLSSATLHTLRHFQHVLWDHAARYRNLVSSSGLDPQVVLQEHSHICDAVLAHDVEMACLLLRRHIEKAGESVLAGLRRQTATVGERSQNDDSLCGGPS